MSAWTVIEHKELGSANSSIEFTSIPQSYTDLIVLGSVRGSSSAGLGNFAWTLLLNGVTTNRTWRLLFGSSSVGSISGTGGGIGALPGANETANTFASFQIYIPNYAGSTNKSFSVDNVAENNSSTIYELDLLAGLWSSTAAITSLSIGLSSATNLVQYSSVTLYGVLKGSSGGVSVS
jgi:hypothetical protein